MRWLIALLLLCCSTACNPVRVSTHNTLNPVMFGPVRSFDGAEPLGPQTGLNGMPVMVAAFARSSGSGDVNGNSQGSGASSAETGNDFDIMWKAQGDVSLRAVGERIRCSGYALFAITWVASSNACGGTFTLHEPKRPPSSASDE